ncbi:MAG: DNRLRE domain-containing protein [Terriglobales bacterium]
MKNLRIRLAVVLLSTVCLLTGAYAQITPLGDTYTNSADPTTNYGAKTLLDVDGATQIAYIQFNLSSIPTGASVSQATLKLYVNTVVTAGAFEVYAVNGSWTESTLTYNLAPVLGSVIDSNVPLTTADKNQYILIPMTSTVQGWVNTPSSNNGIALVAIGSFDATFDSKESTTTSHPAELDVVFAGAGTITGVTTTAGSGLTGGGTSGTLNLSLLSGCSSGQVLQWDGAAWLCASVGAGTVTSVAAGTGLTASPSPITGSGTLSINAAVVPLLAAANTFTANQTVNGNLSATGVVTGSSYQIGSNLFAFGSYIGESAFLGFAGSSASTGAANTGIGYGALSLNGKGASNTASGVGALATNTTGNSNTASGIDALGLNQSGSYNTATGVNTLLNNSAGNYNTAAGYQALYYTTANYNTGIGYEALYPNTTGSYNAAMGYNAGQTIDTSFLQANYDTAVGASAEFGTGTITNATALGAYAAVTENNAVVLGSINGVNGATASVNVGIGTTAPRSTLDVDATVKSGLGPTVTLSNNQSGGSASSVSLDFNTYQPSTSGTYNPSARIQVVDAGHYDDSVYFQSNAAGAANSGLQDTMSIDPAGDVHVYGTLTKGGGSFKIDHPLDPANKYLYHSFVESPDMMNIYNGVATLDARGSVWITLPGYFEALNEDFRYQLTSMGRPQPSLYVAKEISGNRFRISGGKPGGKVSWQVTGIRHDAYADAHRIKVEVEKPPQEQGRYLHPELFGAPAEQAIGYHAPPVPAQAESARVSSLKTPTAPLK